MLHRLLIIVALGIVIILLYGCRTETMTNKTYYESGQIKSDTVQVLDGCINWSSGDGKTLNMPLSTVSGINLGK